MAAGVSNFKPVHVAALIDATGVAPAVNQIELSPAVTRWALVAYLEDNDIVPEAWSPLGLDHRVPESGTVTTIARAHGVPPAQVVLRWEVQRGIVAIPKSGHPERQRENLDVFGFELTEEEMSALAAMDRGEQAVTDSDVHEEF